MTTAKTVQDVILGEAGGSTPQERYQDMLAIASVIQNRANALEVAPQDVVGVQREFNAYGNRLPAGVENYRGLANRAWNYVQTSGPVIPSSFYATPKAARNLPRGLRFDTQTKGHMFFNDPKTRNIVTAKGSKNWKVTPTPKSGPGIEFRDPEQDKLTADAVALYTKAARDTGRDIYINSGHRTPEHNRKVGGKPSSYHLKGHAADISLDGMTDGQKTELVEALQRHGATRFITYDKYNHLHADIGDHGRDTKADRVHFMHNSTGAQMAEAPAWFQAVAARSIASRNMLPTGPNAPLPESAEIARSRNNDPMAQQLAIAAGDPLAQAGIEMAFGDPTPALEAARIGGLLADATMPTPAPMPGLMGALSGMPPQSGPVPQAQQMASLPGLGGALYGAPQVLQNAQIPESVFRGFNAGALGLGPPSLTAKSLDPQPIQVAPTGRDFPVPTPAPRASQQTAPISSPRTSGPTPPTQTQLENNGLLDNAFFASTAPRQTPANGLHNSPEAFTSLKAAQISEPFDVSQVPFDVEPRQGPQPTGGLLDVPVPTLRPDRGEFGFDARQEEPGGFGFDVVPGDQLGNPPRSGLAKAARGLAPYAASAVAGPFGGVAVKGLQAIGDWRARSDPGYFPDAPKSSGGLFGNLFGLAPVKGESKLANDVIKSGPGSASYGGSGMGSIQGIMSSTGPGVANPDIGTVAESRSNPGFSVVGLGPVGYGRQSSKYGWAEVVGPFGTSHHPGKQFSTTVDPATGRKSVSLVGIGKPGRRSVIAATRGPSRGLSFGRGPARGLASFFSSLFGPATTPAPAVNPAAVSFAPGPTTGPLGFSPGGLGGPGVGFGGLAGGFGPAGPGFGSGAHSNSTDAR